MMRHLGKPKRLRRPAEIRLLQLLGVLVIGGGIWIVRARIFAQPREASPLTAPVALSTPSLSANGLLLEESNVVVDKIPEGMRAITVRVDTESAVEGWARAGNFVDVILVRPSKEQLGGYQSLIVAEHVKILSAGSSTQTIGNRDSAPKAPNTVTLLVGQEDALRISTAAGLGKLTFALRGLRDDSPTVAREIDQARILGSTPPSEDLGELFTGRARGPDGKTYLLKRNAQWVETDEGALSQLGSVGGVRKE